MLILKYNYQFSKKKKEERIRNYTFLLYIIGLKRENTVQTSFVVYLAVRSFGEKHFSGDAFYFHCSREGKVNTSCICPLFNFQLNFEI